MPTSPPRPTSLTFITTNPHKLSEVRTILLPSIPPTDPAGYQAASSSAPPPPLALHSLALEIAEVQAGSVEEIAREKCRRAAELVGPPFCLVSFSFFFFQTTCFKVLVLELLLARIYLDFTNQWVWILRGVDIG
jgi:Ham1 family